MDLLLVLVGTAVILIAVVGLIATGVYLGLKAYHDL